MNHRIVGAEGPSARTSRRAPAGSQDLSRLEKPRTTRCADGPRRGAAEFRWVLDAGTGSACASGAQRRGSSVLLRQLFIWTWLERRSFGCPRCFFQSLLLEITTSQSHLRFLEEKRLSIGLLEQTCEMRVPRFFTRFRSGLRNGEDSLQTCLEARSRCAVATSRLLHTVKLSKSGRARANL